MDAAVLFAAAGGAAAECVRPHRSAALPTPLFPVQNQLTACALFDPNAVVQFAVGFERSRNSNYINTITLAGPDLPRILLLLAGGVTASIVFTGRVVLLLMQLRSGAADELPQQAANPKPQAAPAAVHAAGVPMATVAAVSGTRSCGCCC